MAILLLLALDGAESPCRSVRASSAEWAATGVGAGLVNCLELELEAFERGQYGLALAQEHALMINTSPCISCGGCAVQLDWDV